LLSAIQKSKRYHALLITCGLWTAVIFTILNYRNPAQFIYLVTFPLFIRNVVVVYKNKNAEALDPELKKLALTTLLFALTFGYGLTFH
jgi:1,4-dihydroxy-2-naphthoate octaprenyltransferase